MQLVAFISRLNCHSLPLEKLYNGSQYHAFEGQIEEKCNLPEHRFIVIVSEIEQFIHMPHLIYQCPYPHYIIIKIINNLLMSVNNIKATVRIFYRFLFSGVFNVL